MSAQPKDVVHRKPAWRERAHFIVGASTAFFNLPPLLPKPQTRVAVT